MFHPSMKDKMTALEDRKAVLTSELADADDEQPLRLHPGLADTYREKVANLTAALNEESCRTEAANHIRALLSEIRLIPKDGMLSIELVGELAGIMALSQTTNARSKSTGGSITLVAGACNQLNLLFAATGLK